jgi:TolA-binding protein
MSIVDLHPEDLLDKHARGTLSSTDRSRLDAHVATCAACRFELLARVDFAVLDEPRAVAPRAPVVVPPVAAQRGRSRRRGLVVGIAAVLLGGMSFAALQAGLIGSKREPPATSTAPAAVSMHSRAATPVPEQPVAARSPVEPQQGSASGVERAAAAPDVDVRTEKEHRNEPRRARPTASAAALFRAANGARREHDVNRAIALYRELEARYPRSDEASVSYATVATLLLDQGDAHAALDGFDQYLSRGDHALGEEALVGRALAFQKLGADASEIAAWQEVLRRFPGSVHARTARARLVALGQR